MPAAAGHPSLADYEERHTETKGTEIDRKDDANQVTHNCFCMCPNRQSTGPETRPSLDPEAMTVPPSVLRDPRWETACMTWWSWHQKCPSEREVGTGRPESERQTRGREELEGGTVGMQQRATSQGCRHLLTGGDTHRVQPPESTSPAHTSTLALAHSRQTLTSLWTGRSWCRWVRRWLGINTHK